MRSISACLAAALAMSGASGCAGSSNPSPVIPEITSVNPATVPSRTAARLFAAGPDANTADGYPEFAHNPAPVEQITTGLNAPTGMAVDDAGNLYVCNNAGQNAPGKSNFWTVTVYKRGQTTPFRTYTNGVWSPTDVAVAADGTVYIANISSAVTVYRRGSVNVARTLQAPANMAPVGLAIDAAGNAFVSYVNPSFGGSIYEYAPGQTQGTNLGIAFPGNPHGLAVDNQGNLAVAVSNAPNSGSSVEVFAPGSKQPKTTIKGTFQPFMLAFSRSGRRLFVADYGSGNNDGGVFAYSYPTGTLLFKDTQGSAAGAYGVAVDPRATP